MTSLFQRVSQSAAADSWRRFRIAADDLERFLLAVKAVGITLRESADQTIRMGDGRTFVCVIEPGSMAPSPFRVLQDPVAVSFTEDEKALEEYRTWNDATDNVPLTDGRMVTALRQILRGEERTSWLALECTILHAVQSLSQLDLEGEPLFLGLTRQIRDLLNPDLLELSLDDASDFWPGRPEGWTWTHTRVGVEPVPVHLTPRLQRLLHRRDRVLYVEDFSAAPDIQIGGNGRAFRSGFLLPLIAGAKPLGVLRLFYGQELVPLAGDIEAIELLRRELSVLLDRGRTHLRMQRMATVDGLTNLFNHRFFREQLRTEFQRALRYRKMMAVIMIDIDDFKLYNDTYGHLAGDRVLAETARAIRSAVRDIDFVARYGGEEFALILPEVDAKNGIVVAEKIRSAVEAQRFISDDGEEIGAITVSCGVTDNNEAEMPETLIERADRALYWVKRHGRNLVRMASAEDHE